MGSVIFHAAIALAGTTYLLFVSKLSINNVELNYAEFASTWALLGGRGTHMKGNPYHISFRHLNPKLNSISPGRVLILEMRF